MKNVLFITYFWPPSGKATLHWPLRMIQYLPGYDWQPFVLTANEDTFSSKDESLLKEIDPHLQVYTAPTLEPFDLYRRLLGKDKNTPLTASETISKTNKNWRHRLAIWMRMNLFIPDARVGWYWKAVQKGEEILKKENIHAIISIGPPHTTLLVGNTLSTRTGIPHIPVFIDPWVDISYYHDFKRSALTVALDRRLERSVLQHASQAVFVTENMKNHYRQQYPDIKSKSRVLYWGYDESAFQEYAPIKSNETEILLHAGNIYEHQNPINLWPTLKQEIEKGRNLKLVFIGTVGPGIRQSIQAAGLQDRTEYKGFLPYKQMIEEIGKASYLLVCASEKRHVPGKLFEYLRSEKPILAFGDDNKEVEDILCQSKAGMVFPLHASAQEFFERSHTFHTDQAIVQQFDRKNIAGKLAQILQSITS